MVEQKDLCLTLQQAGLVYLIQAEFDREIRRLHEGEYGEYKTAFLSGGAFHVFLLWLNHDFRESPEALASQMEGLWVK